MILVQNGDTRYSSQTAVAISTIKNLMRPFYVVLSSLMLHRDYSARVIVGIVGHNDMPEC